MDHIHNKISHRWFEYASMDRSNLSTRYYNRVMRGGSRFLLARIKKDQMIKLLLENEFGKQALKDYEDQVSEWKACEWYCSS